MGGAGVWGGSPSGVRGSAPRRKIQPSLNSNNRKIGRNTLLLLSDQRQQSYLLPYLDSKTRVDKRTVLSSVTSVWHAV